MQEYFKYKLYHIEKYILLIICMSCIKSKYVKRQLSWNQSQTIDK